jgi:tRNA-dihydrouridine synthase
MDLDDRPAVQLFGNSVKGIKSFIKKYDSRVSLWDFNLGCPSKLSKRLEYGAFMHGDLDSIEKILRVMRSATDKPVTIKLRKSDKAIRIAKMAEEIGVDAIGIHARTFGQGYSGNVDYDFALKLKKAVGIPVIYSGDVDEKNIDSILKDFDFVFVGRACIGNPGFFSGKRIGFGEYLKLTKKYGLFFRQVKFQAMNWTKGMKGAKRLREGLIGVKSVSDIENMMGKNI